MTASCRPGPEDGGGWSSQAAITAVAWEAGGWLYAGTDDGQLLSWKYGAV
jgi:hypothetical protein